MKLSVIGLGKLGLPMSAYYASRGNEVIGLDYNKELLQQIRDGYCPYYEAQLPELLLQLNSNFNATDNYAEAIGNSDITFIIVPTPSDSSHRFSNKYIESAVTSIAQELKNKKDYHLVVITSTVMPGTMENVIKPILENVSGKTCRQDFGLCYNPEFIALGTVIRDLSKPDAILIGESDAISGETLAKFYESVCLNNPPVSRMSWWNAEVAKLALNVFITTKISLANTIADVCQAIPTGNANDITSFLRLDSRIGSKYLKPGLSFGGPCFPRDNRAFIQFAQQSGIDCPIQEATDTFNKQHSSRIAQDIISIIKKHQGTTISILGLTYKPNTSVIEESPAIAILSNLPLVFNINVYDPQGIENTKRQVGSHIHYAKTARDCIKNSDLCIIATQWREFSNLGSNDFKGMRTKVVYDCWGILNRKELEEHGIEYHAVGVNS